MNANQFLLLLAKGRHGVFYFHDNIERNAVEGQIESVMTVTAHDVQLGVRSIGHDRPITFNTSDVKFIQWTDTAPNVLNRRNFQA